MSRFGLVVLCVLLLFGASEAFPHDWYSQSCCGGHDCHPVLCTEILEQAKGYLTWNHFTFSPEQVHPSEDNQCHVCIHTLGGYLSNEPRPVCIYIQQGS